MGFNKGSFGEFNAQAAFEDEQTYRTMGDQWVKNSLYLSDLKYLGHFLSLDQAVYILSDTLSYTDTNTDRNVTGTLRNDDITDYVPTDISRPKGAYFAIRVTNSINGPKTKSITQMQTYAYYSHKYDTTPAAANILVAFDWLGMHQDADNIDFYNRTLYTAIIPIHYIDGKYYITWRHDAFFIDMINASDTYQSVVSLSLLGFFI